MISTQNIRFQINQIDLKSKRPYPLRLPTFFRFVFGLVLYDILCVFCVIFVCFFRIWLVLCDFLCDFFVFFFLNSLSVCWFFMSKEDIKEVVIDGSGDDVALIGRDLNNVGLTASVDLFQVKEVSVDSVGVNGNARNVIVEEDGDAKFDGDVEMMEDFDLDSFNGSKYVNEGVV